MKQGGTNGSKEESSKEKENHKEESSKEKSSKEKSSKEEKSCEEEKEKISFSYQLVFDKASWFLFPSKRAKLWGFCFSPQR
jgi:hypothetical protein